MTRTRNIGNIIKFIILFALAIVYLAPIIMMLLGSVKTTGQALKLDLSWPETFVWENYSYVIKRGHIFRAYGNSLIITSISTIFVLLTGAFAGIYIGRTHTKKSTRIYYYFIFGLTLTLQTASTFALLKILGIYGSTISIIFIYIGMRLPFTVMTFSSFVKGVPREIDEAGIVDGCNNVQVVFKLLLPIMKPIMITNLIIVAIGVWNDFMIPLFYLKSSSQWTIPLTVYNFFGMYARNWNYVFATLVLTALPAIGLYLCLQKYIVEGMTAGSVKG